LKEEQAIIAFDEFALQSKPYTHYVWAEKNSKPKIASNEKNYHKINGFLAVDIQRGTTQIEFKKRSNFEEVAFIITFLILSYLQKGYTTLTIILDNAKIHGPGMKTRVQELLDEIRLECPLPDFNLIFWHTPSYSPKLNPAEYVIHEVRRKGLYQVPCSLSVNEKAERIKKQVAYKSPLSPEQMSNLTGFITKIKTGRF
jgi:transposase